MRGQFWCKFRFSRKVWVMRGYGLREVWVKRGSTVLVLLVRHIPTPLQPWRFSIDRAVHHNGRAQLTELCVQNDRPGLGRFEPTEQLAGIKESGKVQNDCWRYTGADVEVKRVVRKFDFRCKRCPLGMRNSWRKQYLRRWVLVWTLCDTDGKISLWCLLRRWKGRSIAARGQTWKG